MNPFEKKLAELDKGTGGIYVFPPVGKTWVRLLLEPGRNPEDFFQPVLRQYKGKNTTKFMVPVFTVDENNEWDINVKYLVTNKTVIKNLLEIMAGGEYDLLDPKKGHGVEINRRGEGFNTTYSIIPSKNPVEIQPDLIEWERDLEAQAKELEAADRDEKPEDKEEEDFPF